MKLYIFFLFLFTLMISCTGGSKSEQKNKNGNQSEITFEEHNYDFGSIGIGEKVSHKFVFTNTGNENLVINEVKASCGCTIPDYSSQIVAPGDTAHIKVEFKAAMQDVGHNNKSITVYSNAQNGVEMLNIKAYVE